jgi:2'-5' RNA ligase
MAAAIPAHITLVYPDEHSGLEALRQRVRAACQQNATIRVRLGEYRAFPPPDDGCVYLEVLDEEGKLHALRKQIVAPPFQPIQFPFHLTLIHPRTSDSAAEFWRADRALNIKSAFVIDSITVTSSENGKYSVVEQFSLQ